MKKYNAPMLSDGFNGGFVVPATAVASLLVKSFATAAIKAASAVIAADVAAKGVKSVFGDNDKKITGEIPALEPCLE